MRRVFKYPLGPTGAKIEMPVDSKIVCANMQGPIVMLWALVDDSLPIETREFVIVGTGHPAPNGPYVGTVFQNTPGLNFPNGFVWHIFEVEA